MDLREATSSSNNAEAAEVLATYMDLVNSGCGHFKYYLAANSVVDWFGRCICKPNKIQHYFRHEVNAQYDHLNFEKIEPCNPIEIRLVHITTMNPCRREFDCIPVKNRVTGITTLKNRADSDVEDDADDERNMQADIEMKLAAEKTPEKQQCIAVEEQLTPPASSQKLMLPHLESGGSNEADLHLGSKQRLFSKWLSVAKRSPTCSAALAKKRRIQPEEGIRTLLDDSSASETEDEDSNVQEYSELRYVETTGVLRYKSNSTNMRSGRSSPISSLAVEQNSNGNWDSEVRIRISYRQHLSDKQLQFALIIYEHMGGAAIGRSQASRRNLMSEFGRATMEDGTVTTQANDIIISSRPIAFVGNEEVPLTTLSGDDGSAVAANTDISSGLESSVFTIVPLHTPTRHSHTPPATPKRKSRLHNLGSSSAHRRLNFSPSPGTPKRSAARSLRL